MGIVTTIGVTIGAVVLMYIVATLIRVFGGGSLATLFGQTIILSGVAFALLSGGIISSTFAIALGLAPLIARIFAYIWFWWIAKRVLSGKYGEQAQWAAELVEGEDEDFIEASDDLNQLELREIGVLSDSKQELRQNTIERAEERSE